MAFFELNIAMSGLFASQRGLQVTSNNITNASTAGYSRQVLKQRADTPLSSPGVGMVGTGVRTIGVSRVRDSYIDTKLWAQNPRLGEYNVKVTQNSLIEAAFGEPSDKGFTAVFNGMFNGLSDLTKDPSSKEAQTAFRQELINYTKYYNNITGTLEKYQKDINYQIKGTVQEINTLATRIQSLNKQIYEAEIYGGEANSFRDERDLCIDRLSQIGNVKVTEYKDNVNGQITDKFKVTFEGQTLVDHYSVNTLSVEVRDNKVNAEDADDLYNVVWDSGLPFNMNSTNSSGELKGLIDMRDGCGTDKTGAAVKNNEYNGIPYYIKKMDTYVRQFAQSMNEQYSTNKDGNIEIDTIAGVSSIKKGKDGKIVGCYDANGVEITTVDKAYIEANYVTKYKLFTYKTDSSSSTSTDGSDLKGGDYSNITSSNFSVSKEVLDGVEGLRTTYDEGNPSDNTFLLDLLAQKHNKEMFKEGDPKDYMISIFSELGISAKEAQMYQSTQDSVTSTIINQRLSVSQVDQTEEFTMLIKYQQAYQAAAKVMNTIDGIYETTIFKLGNF